MRKLSAFLLLSLFLLTASNLAVSAQAKKQKAKQTDVLIRNATVMTAIRGTLQNTDILIQNGKIAKIGKNLKASSDKRRNSRTTNRRNFEFNTAKRKLNRNFSIATRQCADQGRTSDGGRFYI